MRFLPIRMNPLPSWNACDFVRQFYFTKAHIPVKMNTNTDFLSRLESDSNKKYVLKIREDVTTQPSEVNMKSTGSRQEDQFFFTQMKLNCQPNNSYGSTNQSTAMLYTRNPPS